MSSETGNHILGFSTAGRILFGWGAASVLRDVAKEFGPRVFICTDRNMVKAGVCETVVAQLSEGKAGIKIFEGGQPEVDRQTIERAAAEAQAYKPDVVIGLGGGSNLDLSKAVALLVKYPGQISSYYGENNVPGPITPVVAVPTTAGTGSEVSPVAVVADPERAMKIGIASRTLIPKWAIVDPALTVSCPVSVTAHSGMDALVHAIESYCARVRTDCSPHAIFVGKNPVSDVLATKAIIAITEFLPIAVAQPAHREAREQMALASLLAGMAFSAAGTAAVHALQYPVGEATHTPHGLGNAVLLSTVMKRITPSRVKEMAFIARSLDSSLVAKTDAEAAAQAATLVDQFAAKVGIPKGLRSLGLKESQLPELAKMASTVKRLLDNSPVSFNESELLLLLQEAY
ncbi:MAG TPA: iron-containing alcohol dehydrogenase [Candidatus Acidoferrales bacterium]|jgi:alcohol dehydrogenase|nr:iron-containing alcohol dehydrogenase [Candidatus Acidoferrales bacterium]